MKRESEHMNIRKLVLLAAVCVAAAVVAPIASASATEVGACHIFGTAGFAPNELTKTIQNLEYTFISENPTTTPGANAVKELEEVANGVKTETKEPVEESFCVNPTKPTEAKAVRAEVDGAGELACTVSNGVVGLNTGLSGVNGEGDILTPSLLEPGKEITTADNSEDFEFKFVGSGPKVTFVATEVKDEGKSSEINGAGEADFGTPGGPGAKRARAEKCATGSLKNLPFEAVVAGVL
jgi:hypothetical protein